MLIGAATTNANGSDYATADAAFGPLTCRRSYNAAGDFSATHGVPATFSASNAATDYQSGKTKYVSVYSFKPDMAMLTAGSLDGTINSFLASIPAGHKVILICWHEGDVKVRQGQFSLTDWQDSQERFLTLVRNAGNPDVFTGVCLSAFQKHDGHDYGDMIRSSWLTDGLVDVLLVDGYTDLGSGSSIWGPALTYASANGIDWGIGEVGVRSGSISTQWMAQQAQYAAWNGAVAYCWFDTTAGGVVATPGTGTGPVASAQAVSYLEQVDPTTFIV